MEIETSCNAPYFLITFAVFTVGESSSEKRGRSKNRVRNKSEESLEREAMNSQDELLAFEFDEDLDESRKRGGAAKYAS